MALFQLRNRLTLLLSLAFLLGGCHVCQKKSYWCEPVLLPPSCEFSAKDYCLAGASRLQTGFREPEAIADMRCKLAASRNLPLAQRLAESTYAFAVELDGAGNECCVDYYFQTVALAWHCWERRTKTTEPTGSADRSAKLYRSSLQRLLTTGQHFGRLDSRRGLRVQTPSGSLIVPVQHQGFLWEADSFDRICVVGDYADSIVTKSFGRCGLGVPVVVVRQRKCTGDDESLIPAELPFAATVVLCPQLETVLSSASSSENDFSDSENKLFFCDPLRVGSISINERSYNLAADISAPLVFASQNSTWNPYTAFFKEDQQNPPQLYLMEPYQPQKIPLIFVHGLISDPKIYFEMANELRADPYFYDRYQIWAFEYPTGDDFLQSAARLREHIQLAYRLGQERFPDSPPLNGVLVGHSMGGLVSKLQVSQSRDILWKQVANRPLDEINASPQMRQRLADALFFDPNPHMTRAIFIATPHNGTPWAKRPIGRVASAVVKITQENDQEVAQLLEANPGVFNPLLNRGLPTSIDILAHGNPLLVGIQRLPIPPQVRLHTILGTGHSLPLAGPADGVVPVGSARHPHTQSELHFNGRHSDMIKQPETIAETKRILRIHAAEESPFGSNKYPKEGMVFRVLK